MEDLWDFLNVFLTYFLETVSVLNKTFISHPIFRITGRACSSGWLQETDFQDTAGKLHMWSHDHCDSMHRTFVSSSQKKFQHRQWDLAGSLTLGWGAIGSWYLEADGESVFFKKAAPWQVSPCLRIYEQH